MKANKIAAALCAVTMSLMTFDGLSLPTAYAYYDIAYCGSVNVTIFDESQVWWTEESISKSDLLGDVSPKAVSKIEFRNDDDKLFYICYYSKDSGELITQRVERKYILDASEIDFSEDNYFFGVALSTGIVGDSANIDWTVIVECEDEPYQPEIPESYPGDWGEDGLVSASTVNTIPDGEAMQVTVSYTLLEDHPYFLLGPMSYTQSWPKVYFEGERDYITGITPKSSMTEEQREEHAENVGTPLLNDDGFIVVYPTNGKEQQLTFTITADGVRYLKELAENNTVYDGGLAFQVYGVDITDVQVSAVSEAADKTVKYTIKEGVSYNSPFHFEADDLDKRISNTTARISLTGTSADLDDPDLNVYWHDWASYYICVTDTKGAKNYYAVAGPGVAWDVTCVDSGNDEDKIVVSESDVIKTAQYTGDVTVEVPFGYGYSIDVVGLAWGEDSFTEEQKNAPYIIVKDITVDIPERQNPVVTYQKGDGCVKLNWAHVYGAEQYGIVGYAGGKWKLLGRTKNNSYVINGLASGSEYTVAVVSMFDGEWFDSDLTPITVSPKTPVVEYQILDDGTAEITKYNGNSTDVKIPSSIDGHKITSIGTGAFGDCNSIKTITIPDSVTSLGQGAFSGCTSLTSVIIPDSVTEMGWFAFYGCSSLAYVIIPESLTSIKGGTFERCTSLKSVTLPDSITEIGDGAFIDCTSLTSIAIPKSVTNIDNRAFYNTKWLENKRKADPLVIVNNIVVDAERTSGNVTIPNNVKKISGGAFYHNELITSVTIPNGVTAIKEATFSGCSLLRSVTLPDSLTTIEQYTFTDCKSLKSVTIPDSVRSIGYYAFYNCTSLKSVTVPKSVESIGYNAFGYYGIVDNDGYTLADDIKLYGFKLNCYSKTAGEQYAIDNGFDYELLDTKTNPTVTFEKGNGAVKLTWNKVKGAEKYGIAGYVGGKWKLLDEGFANASSYVLSNLKAGTNYKVAVVAMFDGKWNMDFTNAITVTPNAEAAPDYPVVKPQVRGSQFRLNWTAVDNAQGYAVAVYQNGWRLLKSTSAQTLTYTSAKLEPGTYHVAVAAKVNGKWDTANIKSRAVTITIE